MKSDYNHFYIGVIAVALLFLLVIFGGSSVRGSDQYWYVADVQSLIEGDTSYTSNMYFPGKLLREGDNPTPNYYMHNGFAIHVAAILGRWVGAFHGWLLLNLSLHLVAAFLVLKCANVFLKKNESIWIFAIYLLSPIALWQTINPLLEQSYAFVTALFVYGYLYFKQAHGTIILALALGLGVMSHPIFLFPSLSLIAVCVWNFFKSREKTDLIRLIVICASFLLGYIYGKSLLPSSFQPNLQAIITSAVPGKSNMFWHYSFEQYPISMELMVIKFFAAIKAHFLTLHYSPFFIFTNIALFLSMWMVVFKLKKYLWIMLPACMFLGLYVAMILLQQNQPRYQQIVAPVSFLVIALFISEYVKSIPLVYKAALVTAIVVVNLYVLNISRNQSFVERDDLAKIQNVLSAIEGVNRLAIFDIMPHNPMSYAVRPKPLLAIRRDMLSEAHIEEALIRFSPDLVVSRHPISEKFVGHQFQHIVDIESAMFGDLFVYTVETLL